MGRPVRPLDTGLEPGDHRHAPTQQPPELPLGLPAEPADLPQYLGVATLGFADALPEGGLSPSHPELPSRRARLAFASKLLAQRTGTPHAISATPTAHLAAPAPLLAGASGWYR